MPMGLPRRRTHIELAGRAGKLPRKAADGAPGAGRLAEAAEHAVAAGDWGHAARLVVTDLAIGRALTGPDGARFGVLFAGMPPDIAGPEAAVVQAAVAAARYDNDACVKHLLRARELVAVGPDEHDWALHLAIAVTEAAGAIAPGAVQCALGAAAPADARPDDPPPPPPDAPAGPG